MPNKPNKSKQDNPEIQRPRMYQPTSKVGRQYIFGYSKCIRNTTASVIDLFSDLNVLHEDTIYPVPVVFGSAEKAVIFSFTGKLEGDGDEENEYNERLQSRIEEGRIDRLVLPMIAVQQGNINFNENRYIFHEAKRKSDGIGRGVYGQEKKPYDVIYRISKGIPVDIEYTINIWAKYYENLMQIVEQIFQKFSPIAYICPEGIPWETPVKMTGSANNINDEIGDRKYRILKYSFSLMAESHITQPIRRDKTALKITQKYVVLGDLTPSNTIDTHVTEAQPGDTPESVLEEKDNDL